MRLSRLNILITAGPTREPIDPVRYISNHSTGKMGVALADECATRGAIVTLIHGPVAIHPQRNGIKTIAVETAAEMYTACTQYFTQSNVIIFAAAVADYTPRYPANQKIKKQESELILELIKTKDIAYELGKVKKQEQICVGFALETENELENALAKLKKKNLDMLILNSLRDEGAGFGYDTNQITIVAQSGNVIKFDLKSKIEVAVDIVNHIEQIIVSNK